MTVTEAALILSERARDLVVELDSAAGASTSDPDRQLIERARDGAEECELALLDLAVRHQADEAPRTLN